MRRRRDMIKPLQGPQLDASDPTVHAAVSASAGSGKTQVLTARVLRLLLGGVSPETILCVTFTKAAAAEMANRIGAQLASWARADTKDIRKDLHALGEPTGPDMVQRARRLFAMVLDCPGGLRIQTIHSFAQTLLAAFPAEAGITPGFEPIEGRAEQELARTTLAALIAEAEESGDEQLLADVRQLSLRFGEQDAERYLVRCAHSAAAMADLGPADSIEPALRLAMELPSGSAEQAVIAGCSDGAFDRIMLERLLAANRAWGDGSKARTIVGNLTGWLNSAPEERAALLDELGDCIVTKKGELCKPSAKQIAAEPDYVAIASAFADWLNGLRSIGVRAALAAEMAAGLRAGQAFASVYARAKRAAGVADFNDLILWSRELLARPGMGDWVRYKLDRRTDHILVDESQDTNAAQWAIVQSLAEEFFAGLGAAGDRHRTMFMVGDFKQAIFRFQGTDPKEFGRARDWVRDRSEALRDSVRGSEDEDSVPDFRDVAIDASFRSSQAVLDAVDSVIEEVGYPNMGLPGPPNRHRAFFRRSGSVELWKPFDAEEAEEAEEGEEEWLGEGARKYATELAAQVRRWLDEGAVLPSTGRPVSAGDILILVRSRGELASLIVARLFEAKVPVAGIDRLHLQKPLAVRDLLAAIAFASQPLDDLNLANLLVSPLIGWRQEQLREIAFGRGGKALWQAIRDASGETPWLAEARRVLGALLAMADYTTPYRFLETILSGPIGGRRKLYSRLGLAARDPIDELVNSALEFERNDTPSLDRFLAWFASGDVEVKRDSAERADAVRVMTVHGAKGLEAPVVILADSTADPSRLGRVDCAIPFPVAGQRVPLLRPRKAEQVPPLDLVMADSSMLDLHEHWRLLYVGMTRAIDRLVVAGLVKGERPENCWHLRVERALQALGSDWAEDEAWGAAMRFAGDVTGTSSPPRAKRPLPNAEVPQWAKAPAPPETRPPRPLAPSAIAEDREAAPPPSPEMRAAAARGTIVHSLLERLPDVAPEKRSEAAIRWLEQSAGTDDESERTAIAELVCGVIADPQFAPLFAPGSLGEAPIAATLPDGRVIAGTVDRLLVEADRVLVVDYKTGRAPEGDGEVPQAHRLQMHAYRDALAVIFPGREVEAALLYTANGRIFRL